MMSNKNTVFYNSRHTYLYNFNVISSIVFSSSFSHIATVVTKLNVKTSSVTTVICCYPILSYQEKHKTHK